MSEQVYILGRGPMHHKPVRFGVGQAARTLRFQLNNRVLPLVINLDGHSVSANNRPRRPNQVARSSL